jgi:hypothetical protein
MDSINILLTDTPSSTVFIGDRGRLSTATSVALLDKNTIACAHFSGKKLYVYRFDIKKQSYEIISSIDTSYNGESCKTDLMTSNVHGKIVTTNFFNHTCTMYQYDGKNVKHIRDLNYSAGEVVHGVKFYKNDILAVTSRRHSAGIHFFHVDDVNYNFIIQTPGKSVQDICFISDHRLVMISTTDSPKLKSNAMWSSVIDVIDFDLECCAATLVHSKEFSNVHLDNIVLYESNLYITDQYGDSVIVYDSSSFELIGRHTGFSFPHGIDVKHGMMAVTNYGRNSVEIRTI